MTASQSADGAELMARLDRIPVWPYPLRVPIVIGAGFFFSFFDVVTIGFGLPVITQQFGVSAAEASWAITSGLIGYIAGSLLDSRIADRFGRRVSLYLSVGFFSAGSLLSATSPDLGWLIFWRVISGMGIGAEIALVTTYMSELSPAPLRGRFTGWSIVAGFLGLAMVPFVSLALVPSYDWGWRALFVIGGLGGVLIAFMRRGLPASPRWLVSQGRIAEAEAVVAQAESRAEQRLGSALPAAEEAPAPPTAEPGSGALLRPPALGRVVLLTSMWFVYYVGNYAWLTLAPDLLAKAGFSLKNELASLSLSGLGFVGGAVLAVLVTDRVERKHTARLIAVAWAAALLVIGWFPSTLTVVLAGFLASTTIGLIVPILYTYTGENFPTAFRATAVAVSDGFGHLGGAFCGQIVFALYASFGFAGAFSGMAATGLLTAVLLSFGVRTAGRSLDEI